MLTCSECRHYKPIKTELQLSEAHSRPWGSCIESGFSKDVDAEACRCGKFESLIANEIKMEMEMLNLKLTGILTKIGETR